MTFKGIIPAGRTEDMFICGPFSIVTMLGKLKIPHMEMLNGSFILATSALHLITVVSACPLGLTQAKVILTLSSIHPTHGVNE